MQGKQTLRIIHSEAATDFGGQEHRIFKEMIAMREGGHHLEAVCQPHAELTLRLRVEGFVVHTMEMDGPLNFIRGVANMRRILKHGRFDVLNTHSRRDTIICATAGRLVGTPLIVRTRHLANRVNSLLSYTWLPHCVTTDSHFVRNLLITKGVAPGQIENIYTPVFKPAPIEQSSLRQELGLTAQDIVVGCVAALRPTKGHLELVRAMAPLFLEKSHLHLVIVGSGGTIFSALTQQIAKLGLEKRVHLMGRRDDVMNLMAGFDMFCLTTRLEASGMVYLEAACAKIPVIGTSVGGVPEMLVDGHTGFLVDVDDDQGLRDIITTLSEDPELRQKMGRAGYDRIWKDPASAFTSEALVRRTEECYGHWLSQKWALQGRGQKKVPHD
jgi:glycosyltransferase involved in cell wall biosynthesis